MLYSNDDPMALIAMEMERTGNYGEGFYDESEAVRCPKCGAYEPEYFYLDGDEHGRLGLTTEMLRMFVMLDRAGVFGQ